MKTLYEVLNVDLAQEYTKARKLATLETIIMDTQVEIAVKEAISEMDFQEAVKVATGCARRWNDLTVEAEKELNEAEIPSTIL